MKIKIIFETHATSVDNEAGIASGWNDAKLSSLGEEQALQLFERRKESNFSAIYCSDLQRSYKSSQVFETLNIPIIRDKRLRECDYGDMNGEDAELVKSERIKRIDVPFPNGESYTDCINRMGEFLEEILRKHLDGDIILIIGHRATQYGLDYHILSESLETCIIKPWSWQPGWEYLYISK